MNEYLCIYDEEFIQLHVVRIKARSQEDAENKFKEWIKPRLSSMFTIGMSFVSLLSKIEVLEG